MSDRFRGVRTFLAELRRREVYGTAIVYVILAAGALELVDVLVPATRLPEWSDELFVALVILGFPLALILAWGFDLTSEGVRRTLPGKEDEAAAPSAAPSGTGEGAGEGAGATTAEVGRGTLTLHPYSIAVLPFETLGEERATAFTDAVHGDILTRLSSVSDLRVISRTSVLRYRNAAEPVPVIAGELGVGWVLSGEVQEAGGRVQVNARLSDARNDRQVWAESYHRELTAGDVFQIQADVTKRITAALEARLSSREERAVDRTPTEDLEAYRLHARGRRHLDQRTEDGMRRAAELFRNAADRDPGYALAWVGLADALGLLYDYGHDRSESVIREADEAARRALELEPELAEAHASLGLHQVTRQEGPAAIRSLERAVELEPSYAEAHNWLSWLHCLLGNGTEALESARRAVELDPLSPEAMSNLSLSLLLCGDPDRALEEARRLRELQPDFTSGRLLEGLALYHGGRLEDAEGVLRDFTEVWTGVGAETTVALIHARSGEEERARSWLARFEEGGHLFAVGLVRAALGEEERAFEAFEEVQAWGEWPALATRHFFPDVLGSLRERPRWRGVMDAVDRDWEM